MPLAPGTPQLHTRTNSGTPNATNVAASDTVDFDLTDLTEEKVAVNDLFKYEGEDTVYKVLMVPTTTQVTVTPSIALAHTEKAFLLARDVTPNKGYYRPFANDRDWGAYLTDFFEKVESDLGLGTAGKSTLALQDSLVEQRISDIDPTAKEIEDASGGTTFRPSIDTPAVLVAGAFIQIDFNLPWTQENSPNARDQFMLEYRVDTGGGFGSFIEINRWKVPVGPTTIYLLDNADGIYSPMTDHLTGLSVSSTYEFRMMVFQTSGDSAGDDILVSDSIGLHTSLPDAPAGFPESPKIFNPTRKFWARLFE